MGKTAFVLLAAVVLFTRFSQLDILWVEEAYPAAAAAEMLRGKFLYRDIWFDKPPLYALVYLLWDAQPGWPLRWAGSLYVGLASALAYRFALDLWGRREGLFAGSLLAIYLTFGIPSAVMALAPDLLTVAPQLAAVYLAWKRYPFWSGVAAAVAFLVNAKAAFVLAVCLAWAWPAWLPLLAGFALPNAFFLAALLANDALPDYWLQVWRWGSIYSASTFIGDPLAEGLRRSVNWAGFHSAAVMAAAVFLWRERSWRWVLWVALAAVAAIAGLRFFPRYYFLLLPVVVLMAARGLANMRRLHAALVLMLLLIPVLRFGPRYVRLAAGDRAWSDLAMTRDSQAAAALLQQHSPAGGELLVWGYRPDIFVYSGMAAATRYMDSQPLTGVFADRHLADSRPSASQLAARNRAEIRTAAPPFIVDGLGPYNPSLAITRFFDLSAYREIGRTAGTVVYRRSTAGPGGLPLLEKR